MGRKSKWGTKTFKVDSCEDQQAMKDILNHLVDFCKETGHEDPKELSKPDDIHGMHPDWQPYSAIVFGKAVRKCRKILLSKLLLIVVLLFFACYFISTSSYCFGTHDTFSSQQQKREVVQKHLTMRKMFYSRLYYRVHHHQYR
jgi:hypothetical protein